MIFAFGLLLTIAMVVMIILVAVSDGPEWLGGWCIIGLIVGVLAMAYSVAMTVKPYMV